MEKEISKKGQIGLFQAMTIGGSILVALITGWFGQSSRTDAKLENINLALTERVAITETKTDNLEKKVDEIRGDVKELLRRIK